MLPSLDRDLTYDTVVKLAKEKRELFILLYRFFDSKHYIFEEVRRSLNIDYLEIFPTV